MNARSVVARLMEDGPDAFDPADEIHRLMDPAGFEAGLDDILSDARQLYQQLINNFTIPTLLKERPYDGAAVAQAVLRLAIEKRGSLGAANAYKGIKRLSHHAF